MTISSREWADSLLHGRHNLRPEAFMVNRCADTVQTLVGRIRKQRTGVYRVTLTSNRFGQARRIGNSRTWVAELRDTDTGEIVRYAGIWSTRREALNELTSLVPDFL